MDSQATPVQSAQWVTMEIAQSAPLDTKELVVLLVPQDITRLLQPALLAQPSTVTVSHVAVSLPAVHVQ